MKIDEAIEILENHLYSGKMPSKEHFEALALAVQALKNLQITPTVDAVPVVRCRECVYYGYDAYSDGVCNLSEGLPLPEDDSYCSLGLRKKEGIDNG